MVLPAIGSGQKLHGSREGANWKQLARLSLATMEGPNTKSKSFSADVRMQLNVNGHVFRIGQLGPGFLILDDPADHPPDEGEITMSIDGEVSRWAVRLPDGVAAASALTRIVV